MLTELERGRGVMELTTDQLCIVLTVNVAIMAIMIIGKAIYVKGGWDE